MRSGGRRIPFFESLPPGGDGLAQRWKRNPEKRGGTIVELGGGAPQQRLCSHDVAGGVVVQGDRDLNDALHPAALVAVQFAPDVFQRFVGFEELAGIEERDAFLEFVLVVQRKTSPQRTRRYTKEEHEGNRRRDAAPTAGETAAQKIYFSA